MSAKRRKPREFRVVVSLTGIPLHIYREERHWDGIGRATLGMHETDDLIRVREVLPKKPKRGKR